MNRFDLFGSSSMTVEEVVSRLQPDLGVAFVEHESSYRGVYYRSNQSGEELLVQPNSPDGEGYVVEPEFEQAQTLVYVNGSYRWTAIDAALSAAGLARLRSEGT